MKILIITNNVKNLEAMKQGLQLAKERAAVFGYNFEYTFQTSMKQFTGVNFNNAAVGNGACVRPEEILDEVNGAYKIACLIYDWDKVLPKPTNPVQSPILKNGCNPIQIPENWYNGFPEVLCDYFLHELCHSGYYFANNVAGDQTHAYIPEFSQKQRWEYYLYLLIPLKMFLERPVSEPTIVYPVLKFDQTNEAVRDLQKTLNALGFKVANIGAGSPGKETNYFGVLTFDAVKRFQKARGLYIDGVVGAKTWDALKKKPRSLIDAIIEVESRGDVNAVGDKFLQFPAYGCMQIRQVCVDDVNRKFGTKYKATDCLGNKALSIDIFNKYMQCYPKNVTDEDKARAWNGGGNWKMVYGKKKWETYSKNLDIYWNKVKVLLK